MSIESASDSTGTSLPYGLDEWPASHAGWVQVEPHDSNLLEYWRRGSTHIAGQYERLSVSELRDGDLRLHQQGFDQFGHPLSGQTLSQQPPRRIDWIWKQARKKMDERPSLGKFDSKPEIPPQVGSWDLISLKHEGDAQDVRWELGFGEATLILEELRIESYYSHTKRPHELRYQEPDADPAVVVSEVPRTSAFEIAVNTMRQLPEPVSRLHDHREQLQSVKGIGPAKSASFLRLGVTSVSELEDHLGDESPVNHHHSTAVGKLLTETIRDSVSAECESR